MMDLVNRHLKLIVVIVAVAIIIPLIWLGLTNSPNNQTAAPVTADPNRQTAIVSPLSHQSDTLNLDSTTSMGDPNYDAVFQPFTVFNPAQLPLSPELQYRLHEDLPRLLAQEVIPTYALTYIQIDSRTINCTSDYDCTLSFYIDSPERYFSYRTYNEPSGRESSVIKQMPLPGVNP